VSSAIYHAELVKENSIMNVQLALLDFIFIKELVHPLALLVHTYILSTHLVFHVIQSVRNVMDPMLPIALLVLLL